MSRIGKHPIPIPDGVTVEISGRQVTAKGKLGELHLTLMEEVEVKRDGDQIVVRPRDDSDRAQQMWGTARSVVNNLVTGVAEGFTRNLEINGVGYRAQLQGKDLVLQLGFSHEVRYPVPDGITVQCPDQTHITVSGADKQRVGQTAAEIRAFRPPEPYKGKGIKYADEYILRKEGKKK
ncbi:MAG: 50S ribosomal protein L6 [Proteobacteria bacterium]|jgi:large subunit ribosomal protein L6|nr:50S ribosomal protein L6 [Pseudomonadota bacterium]